MTWWMMNEWAEEELSIIETYRQKGYTYYQIQGLLEEFGYKRTYESIKKVASLKLGRKDNPKGFRLPEGMETESVGSESYSVRTEEHRPLQGAVLEPYNRPYNKPSRVLAIGDIHAPFEHRYYLDFLLETYQKWNCDTVVCMGDEVDAHSLSRYPADPDGFSHGHELEKAIGHLEPYYRAFPNVSVVTSNHTVRGFKKGFEAGIPKAFFKSYADVLMAPKGWTWSRSVEIDGVLYHHGEGFSGETGHIKAARAAMQSTVIGHIHSHGGVSYIQTEFQRIFGLNTGCGIDAEAYAFAYGKNCANKPTLGCGIVLDGKEAYFIPMSGF